MSLEYFLIVLSIFILTLIIFIGLELFCCPENRMAFNREVYGCISRLLVLMHLNTRDNSESVESWTCSEAPGEICQRVELTNLRRNNPVHEATETLNEEADISIETQPNERKSESPTDGDQSQCVQPSSSMDSSDSISLEVNVDSLLSVENRRIGERHYHIHCQEHLSGAVSVDVFYNELSSPRSTISSGNGLCNNCLTETSKGSCPSNESLPKIPLEEVLNNIHYQAATQLLEELQNRLDLAQSIAEEGGGAVSFSTLLATNSPRATPTYSIKNETEV